MYLKCFFTWVSAMKTSSALTTLAVVLSIAVCTQGCNRNDAGAYQAKPYPMMTV